MSSQQPGRHYSPDGNYWWDGAAWRPVEQQDLRYQSAPAQHRPQQQAPQQQAPQQQAPQQQAPQGWQPAGGPPYGWQQPQRAPRQPDAWGAGSTGRRRRAVQLPLVAVLLIALVMGGGVGAAIGGGVAVARAKPEGPKTVSKAGPDFPDKGDLYMPGVTMQVVADGWMKKANKWACEPSEAATEPGRGKGLECRPTDNRELDLRVRIEYDDDSHVRRVIAYCDYDPGAVGCSSLFATMADAMFVDNAEGELRKRASDWAKQNAASDSTTVLGNVRLIVELEPYSMEAVPAV